MDVESDLQSLLLNGYNFNVRPTLTGTDKTVLAYTFYIKSLNNFVEAEGKLSLTGLLVVVWNDPRIKWSASPYDSIFSTSFKSNQVWAPSFVLTNAFGNVQTLGVENMAVHYSSSGSALMYIGDLFETTCLSDVTVYPFDVQKCHLELVPWSVNGTAVKIVSLDSDVSLMYYTMNGLWDIEKTHTYVLQTSLTDQIIVSLEIRRRTLYHVVLLMVPLCALSMLPALVFLIPVESGERLGYATTSLLSLLLYQTAIASKLPENSLPGLSLLILKTFAEFLLACIILIMTVYAIRFYYFDANTPVPKAMTSLHWVISRKTKIASLEQQPELADEPKDKKAIVCDESPPVTWQDISHSFDRICLLIAILFFVTVNIAFLVLMNSSE
jgi:hypothetical protein